MEFLGRYSLPVVGFALIVASVVFAIITGNVGAGGLSALLALGFAIIFFVLARRAIPSPANPSKRVRRARANGRPTVVHFYSDYDISSLIKRIRHAGVERSFRTRCEFIFVNVNHHEAPDAMEELEAGQGEYLVYDSAGKLAHQGGGITAELLEGLLNRK